jgi:Cutinase
VVDQLHGGRRRRLIGGAVALAPHIGARGGTDVIGSGVGDTGSYNGSVSTGLGTASPGQGANASATVYDYPGSGTPDTTLAPLGTLAEGTQVTIQCYLTSAAVTGPNGQGPNNSDVYWDKVIGSSSGFSFQIPAGHAAVVPDAIIDTGNTTVDQLVPACNPGSGGPASPVAGGSPSANGSGSASPAPPVGSPGACTDVEVVFAHDTGELTTDSNGLGYPGGVFVRTLPGDLPGKTISYHAVQYPADDVTQSGVPQGADDMTNWVTSEAARCPNTKFVLGGYSQGASLPRP